jgi:hypothetical protein
MRRDPRLPNSLRDSNGQQLWGTAGRRAGGLGFPDHHLRFGLHERRPAGERVWAIQSTGRLFDSDKVVRSCARWYQFDSPPVAQQDTSGRPGA